MPCEALEPCARREHDALVSAHSEQERCLRATIQWAYQLRSVLGAVQETQGDRVHFRPASKGIAMVGLLADRPQRGKGGMTQLSRIADEFDTMFSTHCRDIEHGRVTGEKALQSFLISEAYSHQRRMRSLNDATKATDAPVELWFITDEIALPLERGKTVCDVLALRRDNGRCTPILLELKDARHLTRLVQQVSAYSDLINTHATLFSELYGALLGEPIQFNGPAEKWIIWPGRGLTRDPREDELAAQGIRTVGYTLAPDARYAFRVGRAPTAV